MEKMTIPEDLREMYENAQIGSVNYGNSVTGAEYRQRIKLIERVASLESSLVEANAEIANQRSHLENGEEMYVAMRGRCAGVEADLFRCQEECEALQAKLATAEATLVQKNAEIAELRRIISELKDVTHGFTKPLWIIKAELKEKFGMVIEEGGEMK
jgi:chromosome segregation ATPase